MQQNTTWHVPPAGGRSKRDGTGMGNCQKAGICHSFSADGRCISLLKILYTNECIYDCKYCLNRRSNDVERASFEPEEGLYPDNEFYRRNYIEGLFLSSGILKNPDYTMERLYEPPASAAHQISVSGLYSCKKRFREHLWI